MTRHTETFKVLLLFKTKVSFEILKYLSYLNSIKLLFVGAKFSFSGCLITFFFSFW